MSLAAGGRHSVPKLLCHKPGEPSTESPARYLPRHLALGQPSPHGCLCTLLGRSLETLVRYRVVPWMLMRFVHWLEFWGSWKCPCQCDCTGLCVSGPAGVNLSRCGDGSGIPEMPSDLLSSKETKVWKQEPRGKGQNDNKGVRQSLSGREWDTQIEAPPPGDPPPPLGPTMDRGPFTGGSQ